MKNSVSKLSTMCHYLVVFFCTLLSVNICAQNSDNESILAVGSYMATPNQQDSLNVYIRNSKWASIEYQGVCKINKTTLISRNVLSAKNNNITDLIEALVYLKDKAAEWNKILETRSINSYEKEFKEVSFPKLDFDLKVQDENYHIYSGKRFIKKASFVKEENQPYKIIIYIEGTFSQYNQEQLLNIFVNDKIELQEENITKLILLLRDADKLCHENSNIDDLLTE